MSTMDHMLFYTLQPLKMPSGTCPASGQERKTACLQLPTAAVHVGGGVRSQENGNKTERTQSVHRLGDGEGGYDHHVGTAELEAKGGRETGETSTCLPRCPGTQILSCLAWLGTPYSLRVYTGWGAVSPGLYSPP